MALCLRTHRTFQTWFFVGLLTFAAPLAQAAESGFNLGWAAWSSARSFPFGLSLNSSIDLGYKFYTLPSNELLYGYTQLHSEINVSGVLNRASTRLEIYPISILGFFVGGEYSHRLAASTGFDCTTTECKESISKTQFGIRMLLGFEKTYADFQWIETPIRTLGEASGLALAAEPVNSLLFVRTGDRERGYQALIGRTFHEQWDGGFFGEGQYTTGASSHNDSQFVWAQHRWDSVWSLTGGIGRASSDTQGTGFSMFAALKYTGAKGLGF